MGILNFLRQPTASPKRSTPCNVEVFLQHFVTIAPAVGGGCYALPDDVGGCRGWVQFIIESPCSIVIHRLWTLRPGEGNGSALLRVVCEVADCHGVELVLKCLPFGRKPYPVSREQLLHWYGRHGFVGTHKKMIRQSVPALVEI